MDHRINQSIIQIICVYSNVTMDHRINQSIIQIICVYSNVTMDHRVMIQFRFEILFMFSPKMTVCEKE